MLEETRAFKG